MGLGKQGKKKDFLTHKRQKIDLETGVGSGNGLAIRCDNPLFRLDEYAGLKMDDSRNPWLFL